jgi:hypothetical protein
MVPPYKPDKCSVWRRHDRVSPNAAIPAGELYDGVVCVRWGCGRKTERKSTNCKEDFLHSPKPLCCALSAAARTFLVRPKGL